MGFGSLGGCFTCTTVEGLLDEVSLQVCEWEGCVGYVEGWWGVCRGGWGVCRGVWGVWRVCPSSHHLMLCSSIAALSIILLPHAPSPFLLLLQLKSLYTFAFGDSSAVSSHSKMQEFVQKLQEVVTPSD